MPPLPHHPLTRRQWLAAAATALALPGLARAASPLARPWDFPRLDPASPIFPRLYSTVRPSSQTPPRDSFQLADETLACAYAYLHPQSPHRHQPAYRERLLRLLDARLSPWNRGERLTDMSGAFQASYAYLLLLRHRPQDLGARRAGWESGLRKFSHAILAEKPLLYDRHVLASLWLNGDIRSAIAVHLAGIALDEPRFRDRAAAAIDRVMTRAVLPDGGTYYVGFQNEVPTYHDASIAFMTWWWLLTGSPEMKDALARTVRYGPLSVEPAGFQEQSTAIAYKHYYNGWHGRHAALGKAYLFGCRHNYTLGASHGGETEWNGYWSILHAALHRPGLRPATPPDRFIVHDRSIDGPRGRFGDWAFVATGRDVQRPPAEREGDGLQGAMVGKATFVGAVALGKYEKRSALDAALDAVTVEIKHAKGAETDWARGHKHRFLAQDERTATVTRPTFGTLATRYRLSARRSAPATADWGPGLPWLGKQLWLLTPERVVGLVQIEAESDQTVFGLDARLTFCGGRKGVSGGFRESRIDPAGTISFGKLRCRIPAKSFDGPVTAERYGIADHDGHRGDDHALRVRLHDGSAPDGDRPRRYPAGSLRWALVDCSREEVSPAVVRNALPGDKDWAVLDVEEGGRTFRLVHNLKPTPATYRGGLPAAGHRAWSIHRSGSSAVERPARAGDPLPPALEIPGHGHAVVVLGGGESDHAGVTPHYEDIFK